MDLSDEKNYYLPPIEKEIGNTNWQEGKRDAFKLANDFYDIMEELSEAKHILSLHPNNLEESRDKLARFLCFYMNGPHLY